MWGVHTIDRFASMGNNKLPRFNSLYNVLGSLEPVIKIHLLVRRVWRYQRGNQKPYIEEEQTTQWLKEKVQKGKQRSTKHT